MPEPDAAPEPVPLPDPETLPEPDDRSLLELEEPVPDMLPEPEPDALPDPDTLPDVLPLLDLAFPPSPESDELDAEQPPMARAPTRSGTVANKCFRFM
ncbi:MAG: hypothetical protein ACREQP_06695 [Candidatus Binatia bacterium]